MAASKIVHFQRGNGFRHAFSGVANGPFLKRKWPSGESTYGDGSSPASALSAADKALTATLAIPQMLYPQRIDTYGDGSSPARALSAADRAFTETRKISRFCHLSSMLDQNSLKIV